MANLLFLFKTKIIIKSFIFSFTLSFSTSVSSFPTHMLLDTLPCVRCFRFCTCLLLTVFKEKRDKKTYISYERPSTNAIAHSHSHCLSISLFHSFTHTIISTKSKKTDFLLFQHQHNYRPYHQEVCYHVFLWELSSNNKKGKEQIKCNTMQ